MYSIRCERCRARAQAALGAEKGWRERGERRGRDGRREGPALFSSERVQKEGSSRCAARTRGERSGKEMRKSVINWRWDYSRRALRRQAVRRTTWKVLPDTFRAPPRGLFSLSVGYVATPTTWRAAGPRLGSSTALREPRRWIANWTNVRILLNSLANYKIFRHLSDLSRFSVS